jgi:hypothetical protein
MTAPEPKIKTLLVVSEKGSRLSLPSTVRAPLTVTGTSRATGCGLAAVSVGREDVEAGRGAVSDAADKSSFSLAMGAMDAHSRSKIFVVRTVQTEFPANIYMFCLGAAGQP